MRRLLLSAALLAGAALPTRTALAHLSLEQPASRYGALVLKDGPCGMTDGLRSQNVAEYLPGETIEVIWDEYVNHPGHFRISFDDDGDDDFVDPPCLANCDNTQMQIELYSAPSVMIDAIPDTNGGQTILMVTLPNIQCTNCTLQAIQIMTDKPPYSLPGNDIYYQCADLVLAGPLMETDAGVAVDAGGGGDEDGGGAGGEDAASVRDGGTGGGADAAATPDAGVVVVADSGVAVADSGDGDGAVGGGGCTCVAERRGSWGALLVGAMMFALRRRRRS